MDTILYLPWKYQGRWEKETGILPHLYPCPPFGRWYSRGHTRRAQTRQLARAATQIVNMVIFPICDYIVTSSRGSIVSIIYTVGLPTKNIALEKTPR